MIFLRNNFLKEYFKDNNFLAKDQLYNKFGSDFEFNSWISSKDDIKVTSCDDKLIILSKDIVYEVSPKLNKKAIQENYNQPWWMEDIDPWAEFPEDYYQIRQYPFMSQTSRGLYPFVDMQSPEEHLHEVKWLSTSQVLNITKSAEPKYNENYIIAELPKETKELILNYNFNTIQSEDLYEDSDQKGRMLNPHITILSNVEEDKDKAFSLISKPISLKFGDIKKFSKDKYDVIYIDCISDDLDNLRNNLKQSLKNKDSFDENKFHITLAYVNKNAYDSILGEFFCTGMPINIHQVLYSDKKDIRYYKDIPVENIKEESLNIIREDMSGSYFWGDSNTGFAPHYDMSIEETK